MGIVYEAYDRERNACVALKTLRRVSPASLLRFKNEFRALADIKHPNLVTLYELISHEDQWFFTMELIRGVDLMTYLRGDPEGEVGARTSSPGASNARAERAVIAQDDPETASASTSVRSITLGTIARVRKAIVPPARKRLANPARLASAMPQLVAAINALHESGHLHRDIKPSNVMVTEDGRVAVLDFGVVRAMSRRHQTHRGDECVGTPAFMAPEQSIAGVDPSPASDWYSVGVILYEAITGQRPFWGTVNEILDAKQSREPARPTTVEPNVDARLEMVTLGLLRKDPETRSTGAELLQLLVGTGETSKSSPVRSRAPDEGIIGRERQLEALRNAFAETRRGTGITVHVHGRSGMGKSTLVARFIEELDLKGAAVVLAGRCYERESMPYQALDSLVDDLCAHLLGLPRHDVEVLLPLDVASLVRAFPVLRRVEAIALARRRSTKAASDPVEVRKQVFIALRELLSRLAQVQPLVLFIDDLQWGDLDSASFLAMLMEPPPPPLLFMISYRSEEIDSSPILRRLLGNRRLSRDERDVQVGRLSLSQGFQLAKVLLARAGLPSDHAERIARESDGNPFFIQEFVRLVEANDALGIEVGLLNLEALIGARVAALSDNAQLLLQIIALAGSPVSHDVARRSSALSDNHPLALAELRAGHLVRTSGMNSHDVVECFHDRIREAVVASLPESRRPALHLRIARGIESSDQPDSESLAVHFAAAGEKNAGYEHAVIAADTAAEALAFARAATFYSHALALRPDGDNAAAESLGRKLGDTLVNAGRGTEAAEVYLAAAQLANPEATLQLSVRAGTELLRCGHVDDGLDVLAPALRGAGLNISSTPWRTLLSLLFWRTVIRLRGLGFRERTVAAVAPENLARIDAIWAGASALGMADSLRGADIQTRHLLRTMRAGDTARVGRALAFEAAYASFAGPSAQRRTDKILASVDRITTNNGEPRLRGLQHAVDGLVAYQYGQWQRCLDASRLAQDVLREQCTGVTWELTTSQLYEVWALLWQGNFGQLSTRRDTFLADARERGDVYSLVNLSTGLPSIAGLVADNPARTRSRADHARQQWCREGYHLQHYWSHLAMAQSDLYSGDGRAALVRAEEQWKSLKRAYFLKIAMVRSEMLQFRARCAIAAAMDLGEGAEQVRGPLLAAAARNARRLAKERIAWCAPAALLLRAGIQRAGDPAADVNELLAAAAKGFRRADTHAHAVIADYYLGAHLGGDVGAKLHADATGTLADQGVVNIARFARFYAPGLS